MMQIMSGHCVYIEKVYLLFGSIKSQKEKAVFYDKYSYLR